jgi:hypothetical protein
MATVLAKRVYNSASETTSNDSLDVKEPKVTAIPVDWPALGSPQAEKRFWWQRGHKVCILTFLLYQAAAYFPSPMTPVPLQRSPACTMIQILLLNINREMIGRTSIGSILSSDGLGAKRIRSSARSMRVSWSLHALCSWHSSSIVQI